MTDQPVPPVAPPKLQQAHTCKLAVWSLLLGIVSFCCGLFAGMPAVICGIVALNRIGKSGGALLGQGFCIAGIVTGGVGVLFGTGVMLGLVVPAVIQARGDVLRVRGTSRAQCAHNVRQLAEACLQYAHAHDSKLPETLDQLLPYLKQSKPGGVNPLFICPAAKDKAVPSYEIVSGGDKIPSKDPETIVIIREKEDHHDGREFGYLDGHVQHIPEHKLPHKIRMENPPRQI